MTRPHKSEARGANPSIGKGNRSRTQLFIYVVFLTFLTIPLIMIIMEKQYSNSELFQFLQRQNEQKDERIKELEKELDQLRASDESFTNLFDL